MLHPREMHTDLMRPPGFQLHIQQRESIERTPHTIQRQRIPPATHDRHARPVRTITRQRLIDLSCVRKHAPMDQRQVRLVNSPIAKLIRQILERGFSLATTSNPDVSRSRR